MRKGIHGSFEREDSMPIFDLGNRVLVKIFFYDKEKEKENVWNMTSIIFFKVG